MVNVKSPHVVTRAMTILRSSPAMAFTGGGFDVTNNAPFVTTAPHTFSPSATGPAEIGLFPGPSELNFPMVQNVSYSHMSNGGKAQKALVVLPVTVMFDVSGL